MPPPLRRAAALGLSYRALTEGDFAFTAVLYASTRTEELEPTGWPEEVKRAFLAQQHEAQHRHYQGHYPGAEWLIVEKEGAAIGRIYIHEREGDIRLIDIALLPEHRRAGFGGAMLGDLITWAAELGKSVSLHVEPNNVIRPYYLRIGFVSQGLAGAYEAMLWRPDPQPQLS